ncbi:MAG: NAD-dependent epimerase/dehydratase family protein [Sulfuritalea sp.]|nr:NAD-dependent epimerase/dehydratase family protein [Sulfuritalea sp.]
MTAAIQFPVQPVILCGGSGTRLWPRSRAGFPKREFLYVDDIADACVFLMEQGIGEGIALAYASFLISGWITTNDAA